MKDKNQHFKIIAANHSDTLEQSSYDLALISYRKLRSIIRLVEHFGILSPKSFYVSRAKKLIKVVKTEIYDVQSNKRMSMLGPSLVTTYSLDLASNFVNDLVEMRVFPQKK